jgi:hypothetical protein
MGSWVNKQRDDEDILSLEERNRLESLKGWSWDPHSDAWEKGYERLRNYCQAEDHCRVPASYKTKDGFNLGSWVVTQRVNKDTLSLERRNRLESLKGWSWDRLSDAWEESYRRLQR